MKFLSSHWFSIQVALGLSLLSPGFSQAPAEAPAASTPKAKTPIPKIVPEDAPSDSAPAAEPAKAKQTTVAPAEPTEKEPGKVEPPPAKNDLEGTIRVQIFLDEHNFGPGKIDGEIGEFTLKAGQIFNQVDNIEKDNWFYIIKAARKLISSTYAAYKLQENDFRFIVPALPTKPEIQAQYKYLGYRSIAEFVSEKYHTSVECLERINPGVSINSLKAGDIMVVPNVKTPFLIEHVPYSQKYGPDPILSQHSVIVDTKERVATFYDDKGKLFASFPITPGQKKFIHIGHWLVQNMVSTPEFRWDASMLNEGKRSEKFYQLPPGPNNPVGIFWAGTSKTGIGLHGTNSPETIGRSESHGCVRLANWDAIRLPELIRPGAKMEMK